MVVLQCCEPWVWETPPQRLPPSSCCRPKRLPLSIHSTQSDYFPPSNLNQSLANKNSNGTIHCVSFCTSTMAQEQEANTMDNAMNESTKEEAPAQPVDEETDLVPQLSNSGITVAEMNTAIRVLNAVATLHTKKRKAAGSADADNADNANDEGLEKYKHSNLRPLRKALACCLDLHKRTMFQGKDEEAHYEQRVDNRRLKRQKMAEQAQHQKYIAETVLRKGRVERLQKLQEDSREEEHAKLLTFMIPDGHVETTTTPGNSNLLEGPKVTTVTADDGNENGHVDNAQEQTQLPKLRSCYVCKVRFRELHKFYDQLCPSCATVNWDKRHQTADLTARVAIVTGSRVKIGYQTCLKLLRAGCTVVATTRFPHAAAATYRQEADFDQWKDRLEIYGLDFRDVTGLEAFTRFLKMRYASGIDILINNACQTVRRPRGYYIPMVENEQTLWEKADDVHKAMLGGCGDFEKVRRRLMMDQKEAASATPQLQSDGTSQGLLPMTANGVDPIQSARESSAVVAASSGDTTSTAQMSFETTGLSHSAAMSQMVIVPEDMGVSDSVLPPGLSDVNGQQLDLRTTNSWLLKMEEVSTPEIMECMFINAIAPFVLNSRLKPLMTTPGDDSRPDRYIINVSAMEGKFYRYKMPNHPHTNMAKAALNMLTRTSAEDLAKKHRIYMNSVDTGWINDENPLEKASKTAETNLFQTPIDEIDAAARIVDPIFTGVNGGRESTKVYGVFLKDYRETEW
jgi:NAD(P)-dependent dehydrogenase (short-subunit alcohol dehydrogenase family)